MNVRRFRSHQRPSRDSCERSGRMYRIWMCLGLAASIASTFHFLNSKRRPSGRRGCSWSMTCSLPGVFPEPMLLSTKSDYVKNGSGIPLMQLAAGFCVGFSQKAFVMSFGQLLVGEDTPCPTPGNRKK
jgi:hypothetical protein